jgi:hypothetical protein
MVKKIIKKLHLLPLETHDLWDRWPAHIDIHHPNRALLVCRKRVSAEYTTQKGKKEKKKEKKRGRRRKSRVERLHRLGPSKYKHSTNAKCAVKVLLPTPPLPERTSTLCLISAMRAFTSATSWHEQKKKKKNSMS